MPPPNFANVIIHVYVYKRVWCRRRIPPLGAPCVHFSYFPLQRELQKTRFAAALESIKTKLMTIMYDYARRVYINALPHRVCEFTYKKRLNLGAEINFANSTSLGACSGEGEFHTLRIYGRASTLSQQVSQNRHVCVN